MLQPVIEGEAKGGDKVQIFGLHDFLRQTADAVNIITHTKPWASSYLSLDDLIMLLVDNFVLFLAR